MKTFSALFILAFILFGSSCNDRDDNITSPNVRIENLSDLNFALVEIRSDSLFFENIAANGFSDYKEFRPAFFQDSLRIETDSTIVIFEPDSIGDPLPNGLYTYQLDFDEEGALRFTFKVD